MFCINFRCIKLLLDQGADAMILDLEGQTPLHVAASSGALECVNLLLAAVPSACVVKDKVIGMSSFFRPCHS